MTTTIRKGAESPWGPIGHHQLFAPGIWTVSTSTHGGFYLTEDAAQSLRRRFPWAEPFTGSDHWWEEDCDWAVVAAAFPDHFTQQQLWEAWKTLKTMGERWAAWCEKPSTLVHAANGFIRQHAGDYVASTIGSGNVKKWYARFRTVDGLLSRVVEMDDYPEKPLYTKAELDAMVAV